MDQTPGKAEPNKAPPAAVVSGFALVLTCPDVTGNPEAIGETKPAYCCKLKAGAKFCCLCIFSNCCPTELIQVFLLQYLIVFVFHFIFLKS